MSNDQPSKATTKPGREIIFSSVWPIALIALMGFRMLIDFARGYEPHGAIRDYSSINLFYPFLLVALAAFGLGRRRGPRAYWVITFGLVVQIVAIYIRMTSDVRDTLAETGHAFFAIGYFISVHTHGDPNRLPARLNSLLASKPLRVSLLLLFILIIASRHTMEWAYTWLFYLPNWRTYYFGLSYPQSAAWFLVTFLPNMALLAAAFLRWRKQRDLPGAAQFSGALTWITIDTFCSIPAAWALYDSVTFSIIYYVVNLIGRATFALGFFYACRRESRELRRMRGAMP